MKTPKIDYSGKTLEDLLGMVWVNFHLSFSGSNEWWEFVNNDNKMFYSDFPRTAVISALHWQDNKTGD